ncbi:hypothetical protein ACLOJK_008458 [Asimina triloba]
MYWLGTLAIVTVALLPYFVHVAIQRTFHPKDNHVIQEMKYQGYIDAADKSLWWLREQVKSKKTTHIGFTARVNAKIQRWKEKLQHKNQSATN